jgi:DNA-binding transcriptional regulator YiaG
MSTTLEQKMKTLSASRRKKVENRSRALIAEEMTLQELRRAYRLTQAKLAKVLGMTQDQVSRLEQRTDILLSTLSKYVRGMGGTLSLVAEFPDRKPIKLAGLAVVERARRKDRKAGRAA